MEVSFVCIFWIRCCTARNRADHERLIISRYKQTLTMLKDFPRRRTVLSIAEMKEVEDNMARCDGTPSEVSFSQAGAASNSSIGMAFRPISSESILEEEINKDGFYTFKGQLGDPSGTLGIRLGLNPLDEKMDGTCSSSKARLHAVTDASEFRYESLSALQRFELTRFCWGAFRSGSENRFFRWMNCFYKANMKSRRRVINPRIFEIVELLRRRATFTRFIFRYEPDKKVAIEIANDLRDDREIDYENIDVLVLANGLKNYIREHLDGLIPIEVFEKIKNCIVANDKHMKKALFSYVPFVFTDTERKLLKSLFDLFREIDKNHRETEMTLDSLLGLFSLVLHPQDAFTTLEDLEYVQIVMKEIYCLDFDILPQAVVVHELVFV